MTKIDELTVDLTLNLLHLQVWAEIQALIVESKGMEAENQYYVQDGEYPVYTQDHFSDITVKIRDQIARLEVKDEKSV